MQTNKEIRASAIDKVKDSERKVLWGMSAVMFMAPAATIFMPVIFFVLSFFVLIFMYPYTRMVYNNAKGKTVEFSDAINFEHFGQFVKFFMYIILGIFSHFLPFVVTYGVQLVGMLIDMPLVITIGKILTYSYIVIVMIMSLKYLPYPFIFFQAEFDEELEDTSSFILFDQCEEMIKTEKKEYISCLFSLLGPWLLSLLVLGNFFVVPLIFTVLGMWFYNHKYGGEIENYYDRKSSELNSNIDATQNYLLANQQQELKTNRRQAINNYAQNQQMQNLNSMRGGYQRPLTYQQPNTNVYNPMNRQLNNQQMPYNNQVPNNQNMNNQMGYNRPRIPKGGYHKPLTYEPPVDNNQVNEQTNNQRMPYNNGSINSRMNGQMQRNPQYDNPYYNPYNRRK